MNRFDSLQLKAKQTHTVHLSQLLGGHLCPLGFHLQQRLQCKCGFELQALQEIVPRFLFTLTSMLKVVPNECSFIIDVHACTRVGSMVS